MDEEQTAALVLSYTLAVLGAGMAIGVADYSNTQFEEPRAALGFWAVVLFFAGLSGLVVFIMTYRSRVAERLTEYDEGTSPE